ncbi:hypothetical protein [Prauserella cavernicola]|uniref:Uncharacterized protein n=1 Tax=Prauserella cavernicola TaxID=2800127 RepID=A0A934V6R2_9PSEU|nr:hypothetical protein [Prauserella cavernicola]MBK1787797.1 hypothetical protein [Prauserella cavernicola]
MNGDGRASAVLALCCVLVACEDAARQELDAVGSGEEHPDGQDLLVGVSPV